MKKEEYLENFDKKYYLFGSFNINGVKKDIPLYHGSLRSILKYTTYKDLEKHSSIGNIGDFRKILEHNLLRAKSELFSFNFEFNNIDFFMSSHKDGSNRKELKFSDSRDLLFCNSNDIYYFLKKNISENELENISFVEFLLKMIDENYKEKLSHNRDDHNRTTTLDVIRKTIGVALNEGRIKKEKFEDMILKDSKAFLELLEYICKDIDKKEILINKVLSITGKREILSDEEKSKRSYILTCKLKKTDESRKYIENQIYDSLEKEGLVIKEEKEEKKENSTPKPSSSLNNNPELNKYLEWYQNEKAPKKEEDKEEYVDDDFLGPKEPNDPRYKEIN